MASTPVMIAQGSFHNAASTSLLVDANLSFGASSGSGHSANAWFYNKDATLNTVADRYQDVTNFLTLNTGPSTADDIATLTSFDSGGFTESWTTNAAVADDIVYFAIGPTAHA